MSIRAFGTERNVQSSPTVRVLVTEIDKDMSQENAEYLFRFGIFRQSEDVYNITKKLQAQPLPAFGYYVDVVQPSLRLQNLQDPV